MFPVDHHDLIHREQLLDLGFSDYDIRKALADKQIDPVSAGVYTLADPSRSAEHAHRLVIDAARVPTDAAFSFESAAVLHGLPMLQPTLNKLDLTAVSSDTGYVRPRRHLHPGPIASTEVTTIGEHVVTSLERTVFDVARTSPKLFPGALAVVDAGLRMGADREVLAELAQRRARGVNQFRKALEFANPLSENPGESWGRAQMIAARLPVPRLQCNFRDASGFVGRTDYDWADRLIGEFDGMVKYLKYRRPGETIEQTVIREKAREDRLRAMGMMVVRWVWRDLETERVVAKLLPWLTKFGLVAA